MKIQYIFLLLFGVLIYMAKCDILIIPTNYTLSYFQELDRDKMTCNSDKDCPQFSYCETYTINKKEYSLCKFGDFLCPETNLNDENNTSTCSFVNTDIYDLDNHEIRNGFPKDTKPILKTCEKYDKNNEECYTETCSKDEDCFSGACYKNTCIYIDDIYRCSGTKDNKYMKCGKFDYVQCNRDKSCYSGICNSHCNTKAEIKKLKRRNILIFLVLDISYFISLLTIHYLGTKETDPKQRKFISFSFKYLLVCLLFVNIILYLLLIKRILN